MKDTSFGIIPVWNDNGIDRFLLVQSQKTDEWTFPKGHPEAGETEIQSALRELREETGITCIELITGVSYTDQYSFDRDGQKIDKTVKFFVGKVTDSKVTIQEKEISNYRWATYEEALTTISFEEPKKILKDVVSKISKRQALGVDIGNVIINHRFTDKNDEKLYEERYSTIPASDGVFDCLKKLNDEKFHGNIFLISKCPEWAENKILTWLKDSDFYIKTGIKPENVFFCLERHEKDEICRDNNVGYFIDDRLEVLSHMIGNVPHLYLYQPDQAEIEEYKKFLPNVTRVESWAEIAENLLTINK